MLRLKNRRNPRKKVMIYGLDGSGKSTFAETYCKENNFKPIIIDVDDTNYTNDPIVELDFGNDIKTYRNITGIIKEIIESSDYDTIILDGVTSLLELLVSKAKGLKKYSDRSERWNDILRLLINSGKHLIFIGQADMEVLYTEEFQSSKAVIKVNSIVNEKYLTYKKKGGFTHKVVKYRTNKEGSVKGFTSANDITTTDEDPVAKNYALNLAKELKNRGEKPNLIKMIAIAKELVADEHTLDKVLSFIKKECPKRNDA